MPADTADELNLHQALHQVHGQDPSSRQLPREPPQCQGAPNRSDRTGPYSSQVQLGVAATWLGAGSHAGSHTDEQPSDPTDQPGQPAETSPRSRTDLNRRECPYGNLRIRRLGFASHDSPVRPAAWQPKVSSNLSGKLIDMKSIREVTARGSGHWYHAYDVELATWTTTGPILAVRAPGRCSSTNF